MYTQDSELTHLKATLHSLQHQAKQEFDERSVRRQHSFTVPGQHCCDNAFSLQPSVGVIVRKAISY